MRPDDFRELLKRRPLQVIRLHLSTGITFEIRHPELALVGRSFVEILSPDPDVPLADDGRSIIINLLHIVQVEFIALSPSTQAN